MQHAIMRHLVLALLVVLTSTGLAPSSAARSACTAAQTVDSLDVVAEARRDVYRIGDTALVDVWVTDTFTDESQEDVDAGVFVEGKGKRAVFDASRTDESGHELVRLRLQRSHVEPGWARATAVASEPIITPVYCTGRSGYRDYPKLFRIRR